MAIFSCSACGSHSFTLSSDLTQAHCGDCDKHLGSWQSLRKQIRQRIAPPKPSTVRQPEIMAPFPTLVACRA
jgi:hypothetical protein